VSLAGVFHLEKEKHRNAASILDVRHHLDRDDRLSSFKQTKNKQQQQQRNNNDNININDTTNTGRHVMNNNKHDTKSQATG